MTNVIEQAMERLRGHWIQGAYNDNSGNVCLLGAIYSVEQRLRQSETAAGITVYARTRKALSATAHVIRHEFPDTSGKELDVEGVIVDFNDTRGRSEEDVLLVMKKASTLLDGDGDGARG